MTGNDWFIGGVLIPNNQVVRRDPGYVPGHTLIGGANAPFNTYPYWPGWHAAGFTMSGNAFAYPRSYPGQFRSR